jgi:hypothetical protein
VLDEFAKVAITTTTNTIRTATNTLIFVANQPVRVHAFFFFVCSLAFVFSITMAIEPDDAPALFSASLATG